MKREALKKMGLTDEQINSIMETNGHDIESLTKQASDLQAKYDDDTKSLTAQLE